MSRYISFIIGSVLLLFVQHTLAKSPTQVVIVEVIERKVADTITAIGTLKARESIELMSTVTERVVTLNFNDNQAVKQGQLLVELDTAEERAELAGAQALVNETQRQFKRLTQLTANGTSAQSALDQARQSYQAAKARVAVIQSMIDQRRLKAPFDGRVGLRNISAGALVGTDTAITTLDNLSLMKLDFSLPAVYLASIKAGLPIRAQSAAFKGQTFDGMVSGIDSRIDPITRALTVRAEINNPKEQLKPGQLMQVTLEHNARRAMVIPEESLIPMGRELTVFLAIERDKQLNAKQQVVTIGQRWPGNVEILTGLAPGDRVLTEGMTKIKDGSLITAIPPLKASEF